MNPQLSPAARMRVVFDDLARDDIDALMVNWADDGTYFNPAIGPPARGFDDVKSTIAALSDGLQARGETLVIDRATEITDEMPNRAIIEWHVEGGAAPQRLGVHVVLFNEAGLLHRVKVWMHARPDA